MKKAHSRRECAFSYDCGRYTKNKKDRQKEFVHAAQKRLHILVRFALSGHCEKSGGSILKMEESFTETALSHAFTEK